MRNCQLAVFIINSSYPKHKTIVTINKALGQIEQFLANDCRAIQLLHQINVYTLCLWIQRIVINPLKFTRDYQNFYSNILD